MPLFNYPFAIPAGGASSFSIGYDSKQQAYLPHPAVLVYIDSPSLNTTQLPDTQTLTFSLLESNNSDLSAPTGTTVMGIATGAGGVGASAATFCARLRFSGGRYFGVKCTASATAAASGVPLAFAATQS